MSKIIKFCKSFSLIGDKNFIIIYGIKQYLMCKLLKKIKRKKT
jgi:hypothetical protein